MSGRENKLLWRVFFLGDCREQAGLVDHISSIMEAQSHFQFAFNGRRITDSLRPVWVNDLIIGNHNIIISSQEETGVTPPYYSHLLLGNSEVLTVTSRSASRLQEENK